jgi:hypothetical protein
MNMPSSNPDTTALDELITRRDNEEELTPLEEAVLRDWGEWLDVDKSAPAAEELATLHILAKGEKSTQKRKPGWKTLSEVLGLPTKRETVTAVCPCCKSNNTFRAVICINCGAHTAPA